MIRGAGVYGYLLLGVALGACAEGVSPTADAPTDADEPPCVSPDPYAKVACEGACQSSQGEHTKAYYTACIEACQCDQEIDY